MIEDIEGATSEPTRRGHVVVLSAATAAAALVLLVALVLPASITNTSLRAPAPSARASLSVSFVSNPMAELPIDLSSAILCADGTRLNPPFRLVFSATTGRIYVGPSDRGAALLVPATLAPDARTGRVIVRCATSTPVVTGDMIAPHQQFDPR
jgi:hypothetical protein